jgi:hypothetical protein
VALLVRGVSLGECTDLHAGNVLAAEREAWLAIDPKPFIGDPAFDPVQHMLNCDERLATDPAGLARRMAALLDLDPDRVRLWPSPAAPRNRCTTRRCAHQHSASQRERSGKVCLQDIV